MSVPLPSPPIRADAARNRERILQAATTVLASDPWASMADLAAAAGLTRVTLYRHFASRDELIAAIKAECARDIAGLVDDLILDQAPAAVLATLLEASVDLGLRYRYLVLHPGSLEIPEVIVAAQQVMQDFIAGAQAQGEIDAQFSPHLLTHFFLGVVNAALVPIALGQESRADAVGQAKTALAKLVRVSQGVLPAEGVEVHGVG